MRQRVARALILPGLVGFSLFYLLPLGMTCFYAFVCSPFDTTFVALDNLTKTIGNSYFQMALYHTASFTLISVGAVMLLSVFLAFLLANGNYTFHAPFMLPVLLPTVAVCLIWSVLFGRGSRLESLGIPVEVSLYTLFIWKNTGLQVIFLLSALAQLPREPMEAAAIDGAGAFGRLWYVALPQLFPTLFFCCLYVMMCSFRIFREAYLLYGAYPSEGLFMVQHYINHQFTKLHYPEVAAAGLLYAIPVIILIAFIFRVGNKAKEGHGA